MGADFLSYIAVGPKKLSASKVLRKKAEKRVTEFVALSNRALELEDKEDDTSTEEFELLTNNPLFKHLELPCDVRWAEAYKDNPTKLVDQFLDVWHGGAHDTADRLDPNDHRQKIVISGDMSWGDEPDGFGYQTLKRADITGLMDIYNVR